MASDDQPEPKNIKEKTDKKILSPIWNGFYLLRNRVLAGFVVALPVIITFIIIKWLYEFLAKDVIGYLANTLVRIWHHAEPIPDTGNEGVDTVVEAAQNPWFVENVLAPVTAILLIVGILFILGMVFRSRWHRFFNWFMSSVPGVGVIYKSVSNVVDSIRKSNTDAEKFQRVVLIKFPHPGIKVPAFVTSSCTDANTGKEILCIYVPTTPIPTSGYMLMVPAEEVTEISWDLQETLQAIVSGGITVPESVEYTIGIVDQNRLQPANSPMGVGLDTGGQAESVKPNPEAGKDPADDPTQ